MRLLAILALSSFGTTASAEDVWTVTRKQAICLFENLPDYIESGGDPTVIFLNVCPTVDRMEALAQLQQNNGAVPAGPTVVIMPDGVERSVDEVIVYTQEELICLRDAGFSDRDDVVLLPHMPCGS